jgi:hypothetical protein
MVVKMLIVVISVVTAFTLKTEVIRSSKMLVTTYKTTWNHNTDHNWHKTVATKINSDSVNNKCVQNVGGENALKCEYLEDQDSDRIIIQLDFTEKVKRQTTVMAVTNLWVLLLQRIFWTADNNHLLKASICHMLSLRSKHFPYILHIKIYCQYTYMFGRSTTSRQSTGFVRLRAIQHTVFCWSWLDCVLRKLETMHHGTNSSSRCDVKTVKNQGWWVFHYYSLYIHWAVTNPVCYRVRVYG